MSDLTVDVTTSELIYGLGTIATATLELGAGFTVTGAGDSVLAGALVIDGGGEFLAEHGIVQLNGAVTNNSMLEAQNGATIDVAGNIGGTGSIVVDGATVNAAGSVASTQAITIEGAGVVHLAQAEGGQVTFVGAGMLALDAAPASGMTVSNFGTGDSIDLTNLAYSASETLSWNSSTNTLTIIDGGTSESIKFGEGHGVGDFALAADPLGTGGTDIVYTNTSLNYASAVSDTVVPLSGLDHFMGGINNAGVAIVTSDTQDYFFINGHLVALSGAPGNNTGGIGGFFASGINDFPGNCPDWNQRSG